MAIFFRYLLLICFLVIAIPSQASINIATIAPVSGSYATFGSEIINGVQAAVDDLNKQGGLLGEKINLIPVEDECNDTLAVSTAQMIALNTNPEYKISAVIGPYCFNQFQRVTNTLAQAKILQIMPTVINQEYKKNIPNGLIKMLGYQEQQAIDFFDYYKSTFNWMPAAIIFDNQHIELAQIIKNLFTDSHMEDKIHLYSFEEYQFDYDSIADHAIQDGTLIAFILGSPENVGYMTRELKSEKRKYIVFINKYQIMPEFLDIAGQYADKCYFIGLPSLQDSPEFTETLVKLRLLGIDPEGLAVYGYSAVQLWAELVREANSFQYEALVNALHNNAFNMGWGQLMFKNGQPTTSLHYMIYLYHDGEYTQVN